jgi:hypothetical protein
MRSFRICTLPQIMEDETAGRVALMREKRNAHKILVKEIDH